MKLEDYEELPEVLPSVVIYKNFIFPFMIIPIFIDDKKSIKSIERAIDENTPIVILVSKDNKKQSEINTYNVGLLGSVVRKVLLPDGRVKLLFQGLSTILVDEFFEDDYYKVSYNMYECKIDNEKEIKVLFKVLIEKLDKLAELNKKFPIEILNTIEKSTDYIKNADLIASLIEFSKDEAYDYLLNNDLSYRLFLLIEKVSKQIEAFLIEKDINKRVNSKLDKVNKKYILQERLKEIQKELGYDNKREQQLIEYKEKYQKIEKFLSKDAKKEIKSVIERLEKLNPESPDANTLETYLDTIFEIPFGKMSDSKIDINFVKENLDKDHYSLKEPKERIIEYFAVRELLEKREIESKEIKGSVICFVGSPGVGKTSLANSIAKALNRPLIRIALGGIDDVSELRGHRRTYVGAMQGRIVQGLIDAEVMNPVIVLDEIDKLGKGGLKGDPNAVMLEILDPEQNNAFRDLFLNFHIDLSNCLFIATANNISPIHPALRDRMEFIEINSYTPEEKFFIAKDYLIPQEIKKHGLKKSEIKFSKVAIENIIDKYTKEAGVRNLRRVIAKICRKVAKEILEEDKKVSISAKNLEKYLKKPVFEIDISDFEDRVGIGNGLAYTSVGGDLLKIEAIRLKGKGNLIITGNLGEVMKESSKIAFSVAKKLIDEEYVVFDKNIIPKTEKELENEVELDYSEVYRRFDIHLHIPEGAVPKDGPSAGGVLALTLLSILTDKKIKADIALTGEITLTGKILPIGGLREKLIAAYKAKMKKVLIPVRNYKNDLDELPKEVKENLKIIAVKDIKDIIDIALV